jgi:hypothetical protein
LDDIGEKPRRRTPVHRKDAPAIGDLTDGTHDRTFSKCSNLDAEAGHGGRHQIDHEAIQSDEPYLPIELSNSLLDNSAAKSFRATSVPQLREILRYWADVATRKNMR